MYTPLLPALRRQRKEDLCEFKTSLIYIVSLRPARATNEILLKNKIKQGMESGSVWICFPAPTRWLTTTCDTSCGGSNALF